MPVSLRLVVLHHTGVETPHYDFMFEKQAGEALFTWRIAQWPMEFHSQQPATELLDHRREYLEYEGPVSGNRGEVKRMAAGTATLLVNENDLRRLSVSVETQSLDAITIELRRVSGQEWTIRRD